MTKNVFIPALEPAQRAELETVRNADNYAFHGLLDVDALTKPDHLDFEALLTAARAELDRFDGSIDAIIAHWDFPTSVLAPILCRERDIPAPSLESVLACEHKYWSRLVQQSCVPEHTPRFAAFDPFAEDPRGQIDLPYPFWVKPVKGFASQLGFAVHDDADFAHAIKALRAGVHNLGDGFDQVLAMVDLPEEVKALGGTACLAEEIISGFQSAPEGSVFQGTFGVHGIFDMHKDESGRSLDRLQYPSTVPPERVARQMCEATRRYLAEVGFDNGCFNAEFMWDEARDKLWLVEVNTRISQSHCEMFIQVDGMSNHEVAIDVALGQRPQMPSGEGPYNVAAKCPVAHYGDGVVRRVPGAPEIAEVKRRFPGTDVRLEVEAGQRLSDLPNQDSYRFVIAEVFLGAASEAELVERFETCKEILAFDIEPADGEAARFKASA